MCLTWENEEERNNFMGVPLFMPVNTFRSDFSCINCRRRWNKKKSWKINVNEKFKRKQRNTSWLATLHAGVRLNNSVIFTFTIKGSSSAFFLFSSFSSSSSSRKLFSFQSHDYLCRQWRYGMVPMMVCSVLFRAIYRHIYIRKEVEIFQ